MSFACFNTSIIYRKCELPQCKGLRYWCEYAKNVFAVQSFCHKVPFQIGKAISSRSHRTAGLVLSGNFHLGKSVWVVMGWAQSQACSSCLLPVLPGLGDCFTKKKQWQLWQRPANWTCFLSPDHIQKLPTAILEDSTGWKKELWKLCIVFRSLHPQGSREGKEGKQFPWRRIG